MTVATGGKPDSFYVTLVSAEGLLDALADDIEAEVKEKLEGAAVCELLVVGSPCLVFDNTTSKWVRGQVKSAGDDYKVRYICCTVAKSLFLSFHSDMTSPVDGVMLKANHRLSLSLSLS